MIKLFLLMVFIVNLTVGIAKPSSESTSNSITNGTAKQQTIVPTPKELTPSSATQQQQDSQGVNYASASINLRARLASCRCQQLGRGQTPWLYRHRCNSRNQYDCCRLCNQGSGDNRYSCVVIGLRERLFYYFFFGPIDYYCRQDSGADVATNMN
uniref:Cnidarian restricted protein n=1 Tax=Clytia hemisphaerica TaxID=252671 RepID=A0A7M5XEB7_9CNID|eukprot:TCONS_00048287-protein